MFHFNIFAHIKTRLSPSCNTNRDLPRKVKSKQTNKHSQSNMSPPTHITSSSSLPSEWNHVQLGDKITLQTSIPELRGKTFEVYYVDGDHVAKIRDVESDERYRFSVRDGGVPHSPLIQDVQIVERPGTKSFVLQRGLSEGDHLALRFATFEEEGYITDVNPEEDWIRVRLIPSRRRKEGKEERKKGEEDGKEDEEDEHEEDEHIYIPFRFQGIPEHLGLRALTVLAHAPHTKGEVDGAEDGEEDAAEDGEADAAAEDGEGGVDVRSNLEDGEDMVAVVSPDAANVADVADMSSPFASLTTTNTTFAKEMSSEHFDLCRGTEAPLDPWIADDRGFARLYEEECLAQRYREWSDPGFAEDFHRSMERWRTLTQLRQSDVLRDSFGRFVGEFAHAPRMGDRWRHAPPRWMIPVVSYQEKTLFAAQDPARELLDLPWNVHAASTVDWVYSLPTTVANRIFDYGDYLRQLDAVFSLGAWHRFLSPQVFATAASPAPSLTQASRSGMVLMGGNGGDATSSVTSTVAAASSPVCTATPATAILLQDHDFQSSMVQRGVVTTRVFGELQVRTAPEVLAVDSVVVLPQAFVQSMDAFQPGAPLSRRIYTAHHWTPLQRWFGRRTLTLQQAFHPTLPAHLPVGAKGMPLWFPATESELWRECKPLLPLLFTVFDVAARMRMWTVDPTRLSVRMERRMRRFVQESIDTWSEHEHQLRRTAQSFAQRLTKWMKKTKPMPRMPPLLAQTVPKHGSNLLHEGHALSLTDLLRHDRLGYGLEAVERSTPLTGDECLCRMLTMDHAALFTLAISLGVQRLTRRAALAEKMWGSDGQESQDAEGTEDMEDMEGSEDGDGSSPSCAGSGKVVKRYASATAMHEDQGVEHVIYGDLTAADRRELHELQARFQSVLDNETDEASARDAVMSAMRSSRNMKEGEGEGEGKGEEVSEEEVERRVDLLVYGKHRVVDGDLATIDHDGRVFRRAGNEWVVDTDTSLSLAGGIGAEVSCMLASGEGEGGKEGEGMSARERWKEQLVRDMLDAFDMEFEHSRAEMDAFLRNGLKEYVDGRRMASFRRTVAVPSWWIRTPTESMSADLARLQTDDVLADQPPADFAPHTCPRRWVHWMQSRLRPPLLHIGEDPSWLYSKQTSRPVLPWAWFRYCLAAMRQGEQGRAAAEEALLAEGSLRECVQEGVLALTDNGWVTEQCMLQFQPPESARSWWFASFHPSSSSSFSSFSSSSSSSFTSTPATLAGAHQSTLRHAFEWDDQLQWILSRWEEQTHLSLQFGQSTLRRWVVQAMRDCLSEDAFHRQQQQQQRGGGGAASSSKWTYQEYKMVTFIVHVLSGIVLLLQLSPPLPIERVRTRTCRPSLGGFPLDAEAKSNPCIRFVSCLAQRWRRKKGLLSKSIPTPAATLQKAIERALTQSYLPNTEIQFLVRQKRIELTSPETLEHRRIVERNTALLSGGGGSPSSSSSLSKAQPVEEFWKKEWLRHLQTGDVRQEEKAGILQQKRHDAARTIAESLRRALAMDDNGGTSTGSDIDSMGRLRPSSVTSSATSSSSSSSTPLSMVSSWIPSLSSSAFAHSGTPSPYVHATADDKTRAAMRTMARDYQRMLDTVRQLSTPSVSQWWSEIHSTPASLLPAAQREEHHSERTRYLAFIHYGRLRNPDPAAEPPSSMRALFPAQKWSRDTPIEVIVQELRDANREVTHDTMTTLLRAVAHDVSIRGNSGGPDTSVKTAEDEWLALCGNEGGLVLVPGQWTMYASRGDNDVEGVAAADGHKGNRGTMLLRARMNAAVFHGNVRPLAEWLQSELRGLSSVLEVNMPAAKWRAMERSLAWPATNHSVDIAMDEAGDEEGEGGEGEGEGERERGKRDVWIPSAGDVDLFFRQWIDHWLFRVVDRRSTLFQHQEALQRYLRATRTLPLFVHRPQLGYQLRLYHTLSLLRETFRVSRIDDSLRQLLRFDVAQFPGWSHFSASSTLAQPQVAQAWRWQQARASCAIRHFMDTVDRGCGSRRSRRGEEGKVVEGKEEELEDEDKLGDPDYFGWVDVTKLQCVFVDDEV